MKLKEKTQQVLGAIAKKLNPYNLVKFITNCTKPHPLAGSLGKTECITNKLIETHIWFFDTNEGYGREKFICIAKNENDVLKLYKHNKEYPIVFNNKKLKTIRLDNQLILIKKIKIFNTENQVIYDTNYGSD